MLHLSPKHEASHNRSCSRLSKWYVRASILWSVLQALFPPVFRQALWCRCCSPHARGRCWGSEWSVNVPASDTEENENPSFAYFTSWVLAIKCYFLSWQKSEKEIFLSWIFCPIFLVAESRVFITYLKSCCKENITQNKFGWGLTLNT